MDELVKRVCERLNVSPEQGQTAVDTVIGFLKERLPEPLAGQLDNVLEGKGADVGDLTKGLGGLFGKS